MARRMSCALTVDAVLDRTKTVTRRHPDTWKTIKPGDRLTLIEKGMGLAKGERQVVLAEVEVVDVRVEQLGAITAEDCAAEGFPFYTPAEFVSFWHSSHPDGSQIMRRRAVRRIEWRYL